LGGNPVRLGYFMMPLHPPSRDYTQVLKEDREALILADRLGFEEAFVGEHVTDVAEPVTSSLAFIASMIDATKRIKLGAGTVNLPNNHPAQVAAQVAMIDHLLEGRFLFGISPGGLLSDAEVFGNLDHDRTEMFVESIDQILAIWAGEPPYDLKGKYWTVSTARTMRVELGQGAIVKPYQKPHPPIVVTAVAPFSKGVVAAAQRGWTPISANFLQPVWVASHWPKYQEGCALDGRIADPADWRIAKSIFVADDEATAQRYGKGREGPYAYYFHSLMTKLIGNGRPELFKADRAMEDSAVTLDYVLDSLVITGTVDSVVEQLLAFRGVTGDFGTLLYAGHDWVDPALGKRSMELMATEVMPQLNRAIDAQRQTSAAPGRT
jgi:alkanesulfonate monooxygenase SsuD/methylene tetrahydromethanopterin reductase-like flavin-dependent oxidoreductase (luciferase family)